MKDSSWSARLRVIWSRQVDGLIACFSVTCANLAVFIPLYYSTVGLCLSGLTQQRGTQRCGALFIKPSVERVLTAISNTQKKKNTNFMRRISNVLRPFGFTLPVEGLDTHRNLKHLTKAGDCCKWTVCLKEYLHKRTETVFHFNIRFANTI